MSLTHATPTDLVHFRRNRGKTKCDILPNVKDHNNNTSSNNIKFIIMCIKFLGEIRPLPQLTPFHLMNKQSKMDTYNTDF